MMDTQIITADELVTEAVPQPTTLPVPVEPAEDIFVPPKLSRDEETFALAMVEHAGNITRAVHDVFGEVKYPAAYGRQLLTNPGIIWKMKQLTDSVEDHLLVSKASHLEQLARLRDLAVVQGNIKSAIHAEVKRGEAGGVYPREPAGGPKNQQAVQININMASKHDENI